MSTQSLTMLYRARTTTENYNWVKQISDALTALGAVLTSDTGQISLAGSTLPLPSGSVTAGTVTPVGYEIRKLALSGFTDLLIKVSYNVVQQITDATRANSYPWLVIEAGFVTDGAGNFTGVFVPLANAITQNAAGLLINVPLTIPFYLSSDGQSYLTLVGNPAATSPPCPIVGIIERTIDPATGLPNDNGVWSCSPQSVSSGQNNIMLNRLTGEQSLAAAGSAKVVSGFVSAGSGVTSYLFPFAIQIPKPQGDPTSSFAYYQNDIGFGRVISTTVYGVAHSYLTCGAPINSASPAVVNTNCGYAIRFD